MFGIDDQIPYNEQFRQCSLAAVGLLVYAGCRSSAQWDDGAIPAWFPDSVGAEQTLVDELVGAGLWEKTATGWRYVDFLEMNQSKEVRLEKLERSRQRQENSRRNRELEKVLPERTNGTRTDAMVRPKRTRARQAK